MRQQQLPKVKSLPSYVCSGSYLCNLDSATAANLYTAISGRANRRNVVAIVGKDQRAARKAIYGMAAYAKAESKKHFGQLATRVQISKTPWSNSADLFRIKITY